ncbi:hypothetical protein [Calothrix sp. 336/3]|uniref:hypothetical protein n=1 Tax=Calothrix sp. 336/3 TaxID=1337936 RepID=UPI000550DD21|nr:hypothetical protein [Calothrix sp. 336/3]AKG21634.1 hypothetical protein IJ00_10485 [Calothrix sp. 336/3]
MAPKLTDVVQEKLLQVMAQLSLTQQEEVLNFALSLHQQELIPISDAVTEGEDLPVTDFTLNDFLLLLQQDDDW